MALPRVTEKWPYLIRVISTRTSMIFVFWLSLFPVPRSKCVRGNDSKHVVLPVRRVRVPSSQS